MLTQLLLFFLLINSNTQSTDQDIVDTLSRYLTVRFSLVSDTPPSGVSCSDLGADWAGCNEVALTLTYSGPMTLTNNTWSLYISSIRRILKVLNPQFKVESITGDLYKISPLDGFLGFDPGSTTVISMIGEYWILFGTDAMPRYYITNGNASPQVIPNSDSENLDDYADPINVEFIKTHNVYMTPQNRYQTNEDIVLPTDEDVASAIIPTPHSVVRQNGTADLAGCLTFKLDNALEMRWQTRGTLRILVDRLKTLSMVLDDLNCYEISITVDPSGLPAEYMEESGYVLVVNTNAASITAYDDAGAFYGIQSLLSLVNLNLDTIPTVKVSDKPRFSYRGMLVDVARNFHSKAAIFRLIEQMAAYKLNKLHLHLSDDEGWRLEIPGLSELVSLGSRRCHDLNESICLMPQLGSGPFRTTSGTGYFTSDDYVSIISQANAHFIQVIPEFDMPGHSRAAVMSMEKRYRDLIANQSDAEHYRLLDPDDTSNLATVQYYNRLSLVNPCLNSSLNFIDKVLQEVSLMHVQAGQPLTSYHYGGDEAKNIFFGSGFQDASSFLKVTWKGTVDLSVQDHPWAKSPACKDFFALNSEVKTLDELPGYFFRQATKIATTHGVDTILAWQDGVKYVNNSSLLSASRSVVTFWDTLYWGGADTVLEFTEKGFDVVLCNPDYLYLDQPQEMNEKERGYYWASRETTLRKVFSFAPENLPQNAETSVDRNGDPFEIESPVMPPNTTFLGMQGNLWSETVRTDSEMEYMIYPRLLALAERAWHRATWEIDYTPQRVFNSGSSYVPKDLLLQDFSLFVTVLGLRELPKLEAASVSFRIPPPGAEINSSGILRMNVEIPGVQMQWSYDGIKWNNYVQEESVCATIPVMVRSVDTNGAEGRMEVVMPEGLSGPDVAIKEVKEWVVIVVGVAGALGILILVVLLIVRTRKRHEGTKEF